MIGSILSIAWNIILVVYLGLGKLILLMAKPFVLIKKAISSTLGKRLALPDSLNQRFSAFNGLYPFAQFVTALTVVVITILVGISSWNPSDNVVTRMIYNTTFGSFLTFIEEGLNLNPATIVAIAFSSYMLPIFAHAHTRTEKDSLGNEVEVKAKLYIRIPCYMVYLVLSTMVAFWLTGIFGSVGQWGYNLIANLFQNQSGSLLASFGKILLLLPVIYIALLLCLITIKEYAESVAFGLVAMILVIVLGLIANWVGNHYPNWGTFLEIVVLLVVFFGVDALRNFIVEQVEETLEEKEKNKELPLLFDPEE